MRRLSRRLVLPIFGVLWITVLLFFWVNKNKLEVSKGREVQPTKVRGRARDRAARRARDGRLQEGARVCRLLGSQGGGLGAVSRYPGAECGCRIFLDLKSSEVASRTRSV